MSYKRRRQTGRGHTGRIVVGVAGGLSVLALLTLGVLVFAGVLDRFPLGVDRTDTELVELWNTRDYAGVVERAETTLGTDPFDPQALTFGGFGHFYLGVDALDEGEQQVHLERAVQLLRKAALLERAPLRAERAYVLAKAYFHKGGYFMDLSIQQMIASLDSGYDAPDSRSYLALAFSEQGAFEQSADWFGRAIDEAEARGDSAAVNALRVRAAASHSELGEFDTAEQLLRDAIIALDDDYLRLLARNHLSNVLIKADRLIDAETFTRTTIESYPESADAHYYLGVVYHETERFVEARAAWRTARDLDPNHGPALAGLAGNLES